MKRVGKNKGFTLIELLVVIAIIALLLSILIPALARVKLYGQRILCANNTRQQALGTLLYSSDNDSSVPRSESGNWLWDMSFQSTNQMSQYAGFDDNKTFFCAANKIKQFDDARFWQYEWLIRQKNPGDDYTQPVPLRDESKLTPTQVRDYFRVLPNIYMFDKFNTDGTSKLPNRLVTGEDPKWITKLSNIQSTSSRSMIMDAIISENNRWNFFDIHSGGIWTMSEQTTPDNSNHASRQSVSSGTNIGPKPEGSNVAFADGHADWRRFEDMEHRLSYGMWFWW